MKRLREEQSSSQEVYVPFRVFIPSGHSVFTVPVPTSFAKRQFFFSYVVLVPDFYSQQAAGMELDPDEELNQPIDYNLFYRIYLDEDQSLYPESVTIPSSVIFPFLLTSTVNGFFEAHKPEGTAHLPLFFDWYDIRYDFVEDLTWDEYVREIMAIEYYNKNFDEDLHYNKLPPSARNIPGVNNYLFPTSTSSELYQNLRWRLNVAPMVDGLFSTNVHLTRMGFTEEQLGGKRRYKRKYMVDNNLTHSFKKLLAENSPEVMLMKGANLIVSLKSNALTYTTLPIEFSMTKEECLKNVNLKTKINKVLQEYASSCNFTTGLDYDADKKTFTFEFSNNPQLQNMAINLPVELSERLGFNFVADIKKPFITGKKMEDEIDITKSETKARALAYDTSLVIISHNNSNANTTAGINHSYMAALYPTGFGTLEIPAIESCYKAPTMNLPITLYGNPSTVPATFKLSRFLDDSKLTNLIWTTGAYIFGVLRGIE